MAISERITVVLVFFTEKERPIGEKYLCVFFALLLCALCGFYLLPQRTPSAQRRNAKDKVIQSPHTTAPSFPGC